MNDRLRELRNALQQAISAPAQFKKRLKQENKQAERELKAGDDKPRIFVVNFKGDIEASAL